jgi:ribonucleoside-diphosphate reductase alpha chain
LFRYQAKELIKNIAKATYYCGDPGILYEDTIYKWITVRGNPNEITTNPCAEYIWYPNTACNLSSLNIMKFVTEDGSIDHLSLKHAVSVFITALDILVHNSKYPTQEIMNSSINYRNLGLGISNLGATLMRLGIPYDSEQACVFAKEIQSYILFYSLTQSLKLSKLLGKAEGFDMDKTIEVLSLSGDFLGKKHSLYAGWLKLVDEITKNGLHNCQLTAIAPTGTISFLMDCETTGIEPVLYMKQHKNVMDGYKLLLNLPSVEYSLYRLNYNHDKIKNILNYINENGTVEDCNYLKKEHRKIFETSCNPTTNGRVINSKAHINICSSIVPFVNSGISKTINLPSTTTVNEIEKLYIDSYNKGLKSISIFREGSKKNQVFEKSISECC